MKTKQLINIALASTLIIIASQLKVNLGFIPITLQLLTLTLLALTLSSKEVVLSVVVYIITALFGLVPIASGASGPAILMAPSFSFIIGFILLTYIISKYKTVKSIVIGYFAFYALSLSLLALNLAFIIQSPQSLYAIITVYFVPFIVTDVISIALGYFIAKRIRVNVA